MSKNLLFGVSCFAALAAGHATSVHAQEADAAQSSSARLEEVVVTAERRGTNLQATPLAISAVSGSALESRHVQSVQDLTASIPALTVGNAGGMVRISIRGLSFDSITPGEEGRIAFYSDGVYVSRPSTQMSAFYDVDQVEVVRGPQGTLFGRNATGGAVSVFTRKPSQDFGGYLNGTVGNYRNLQLDGAVTGPLSDTLSARVAFQTTDHDGYGKNVVSGREIDDAQTRSVRAGLLYEPTDNFDALLSTSYHREDDTNYAYKYIESGIPGSIPIGIRLGGITPADPRDIASDIDPTNYRYNWNVNGTANWRLTDGISIKSVTSYWRSYRRQHQDNETTSFPATDQVVLEDSDQFSQELQLIGTADRMDWVLGLYYFSEDVDASQRIAVNKMLVGGPNQLAQGLLSAGKFTTRSKAIFGQVTYALTDQLKVTGGARYTSERKGVNDVFQVDLVRNLSPSNPVIPAAGFPRDADDSFSAFTPRLTLDYQFTPLILGYATYSKGFRSGGFALGQNAPAYNPEKIVDYEVGLKITTPDQRLRTNLSSFYYDYTDLQVNILQANNVLITINAATAALYGLEAEATFVPVQGLQLDAAVSYLHSTYGDFKTADPRQPALGLVNLKGKNLVRAPEYTVNLGAQYQFPLGRGEMTLRGEYNHTAEVYFTPFNNNIERQKAYGMGNLFATWEADSWKVSGFVRNVTDETVKATALVGASLWGFPTIGVLQPPRTYGVTLGYKF